MEIESTEFAGVFILHNFTQSDNRGSFTKIYNQKAFGAKGLPLTLEESFYSTSVKGVVRGMHFQLPPEDHVKLVTVLSGSIIDVIIDLRKDSKTYQKHKTILLSKDNNKSIYIPRGFAHGFRSLEDGTITLYNVSKGYNPSLDKGILYNSFGYNWETKNLKISQRDLEHPSLEQFCRINPF